MRGVNKVLLIGNLGRDPEVRYTQGGTAVANLNLATTDSWKDAQGQRQEKTEWHKVVAWDKLAEIAKEYLTKGDKVYIEGKLQTRSWDDKSGNKRYTTEIRAEQMLMLGARGGEAGAQDSSSATSAPDEFAPAPFEASDEDVPF